MKYAVAFGQRVVGRRVSGAAVVLTAIFLASVAARIYAASLRATPVYYPDEYIYTALARSIAATGLPSVRGSVLHFPSLLAPYLMAPAWLIGNVSVAYRLVLDLGAVWFSAAVFPAYALARKIGITTRGSLLVALLSILVPDAALATAALTEPYAYPLFLATMVVAIEAIVAPTRVRQFAAIVLMAGLSFARVEFAFVFVVYAVAALVQAGGSPRRALRAQPGLAVVTLLGIASAGLVGSGRLVGFYSFPTNPDVLLSMWRWFALDLFVLAIAAGWVIVPGALVGLASLIRASDDRARVFAIFVIGVTVGVVVQAAYVDAFQHRIHERYTFYSAPLLAAACVWAAERKFSPRAYTLIAYGLVIAAILVPAMGSVRSAGSGQSPSLLGLEPAGGGSVLRIVWPIGLALAAVTVGLMRSRPFVSVVLAALISASICVVATRALLQFVPFSESAAASFDLSLFRVGAPAHAALVTWEGTDRNVLMKTLFWTPEIDRVLVLGGGSAADGFSSTSVSFGSSVGIVDQAGRSVAGPFAFAPDTTLVSDGASFSAGVSWLQQSPRVVFLGLDRGDRYLGTVAELVVASRPSASTVLLQLQSTGSRRTLTFSCTSGRFDVRLGRRSKRIRIKVGAQATTRCRISLTRGSPVGSAYRVTSGVRVTKLVLEAATH